MRLTFSWQTLTILVCHENSYQMTLDTGTPDREGSLCGCYVELHLQLPI